MKLQISRLFIFFVFALNAKAFSQTPQDIEGLYIYREDFEVVSLQNRQLVDVTSEQGRSIAQELRFHGYQCVTQNSRETLCSKFIKDSVLTKDQVNLIQSKAKGFAFEFQPTQNSWVQINNSESLVEWEKNQVVLVTRNQEIIAQSKVIEFKELQTTNKINIVDAKTGFGLWLLSEKDQIFYTPEVFSIKDSNRGWNVFFVKYKLEPINSK